MSKPLSKASHTAKAAATNPLKMSQPLGGAMAFLGIDDCLPCFHGSQGCTAFGLVLLVRHFREAIPLQTTAMDQVQTILGGYDNMEQAILTMVERNRPAVIGMMTTGLTETKGDDMQGALTLFRKRHPEVAETTALVFVNTPDFVAGLEEGFSAAVTAMIEELVPPAAARVAGQVNILAGSHLTPGDVEEIRDLVESFGLTPIILPDLSGAMGGRQPDDFSAKTLGGTTLAQIRAMGASEVTLVIGEHMRRPAAALEVKTDVPYRMFDRLVGLEACDRFIKALADISGRPVPPKLRRQRDSLVDSLSTRISSPAASASWSPWSRNCCTPTQRCSTRSAARSSPRCRRPRRRCWSGCAPGPCRSATTRMSRRWPAGRTC